MNMRAHFEAIEAQTLQPYAVMSKASKGRHYDEAPAATRTCFQRDRDRIIHSKAFRRLKHKTQVFVATESDHYRSRLTHTLEVAQISRHLARLLQVNEDLCETIALAHDLGHTPFGHSGERELNQLMKPYGGFEHNLQSRRIVDVLEKKYPNFDGLNLSYEVREGLIKHSTPWDNPQVDDCDGFNSIEAQVCNVADEIAYNNHDIDDGLRSGLITEAELSKNVTLWKEAHETVKKEYQNLSEKELRSLINSRIISEQVTDVLNSSQAQLKNAAIKTQEDVQKMGKKSLVTFSKDMFEKNKELRKYLFNHFYFHPEVYRQNRMGQLIIKDLFEAFQNDTKLLPQDFQNKISKDYPKERVVCDYVAGMTDIYADKEHAEIARHVNLG